MLRITVLFVVATMAAPAQWDKFVPGHSFVVSVDDGRIHCVDELSLDPSVEKVIDWDTVKSAKIDAVSVMDAFEVNYSGLRPRRR